jgi:hypothetical protein
LGLHAEQFRQREAKAAHHSHLKKIPASKQMPRVQDFRLEVQLIFHDRLENSLGLLLKGIPRFCNPEKDACEAGIFNTGSTIQAPVFSAFS